MLVEESDMLLLFGRAVVDLENFFVNILSVGSLMTNKDRIYP